MRFYLLHRRAPAAVLLSLVTAFVLLAEAMVAVTLADKWHLSWWEWHLLLTFAFGFVAYSAYVQYRREGTSAGLFDAIGARGDHPPDPGRVRGGAGGAGHRAAGARAHRRAGRRQLAARLAERFGLTEGQTAVLDRAGAALATERELTRRLAALVDGGRAGPGRARRRRSSLRRGAATAVRPAYGDVEVGLVSDGRVAVDGRPVRPPTALAARATAAYPLTVKGRVAGVLEVPPAGTGRAPTRCCATLATQLSITLENARLYRELGTLFRQYMSPDVAAALLADPDQAALGGSVVEVTALFADLRGFTTFSEAVEPAEIVAMLNRYHGAAVPCILDNGGTIVQFVGDALLALFNAPARQADHALRAVRAALAMQDAVERDRRRASRTGRGCGSAPTPARRWSATSAARRCAASTRWATRSTWPPGCRRLAEPGQVVIGEATPCGVGAATCVVEPLGELTVKGRRADRSAAYVVTGDSGDRDREFCDQLNADEAGRPGGGRARRRRVTAAAR